MTDSKDHILKTAFGLFLQKNFKEVTMKEIVDQTGLSKGAFYHYFDSKEKLFEEVINHFFISLTRRRYDQYDTTSLKAFYMDCLQEMNRLPEGFFDKKGEAEALFNVNFFALTFEALKKLPNFKKTMQEYHQMEIKAWTSVIKTARKTGEIKSTMKDEHIARIFLYCGDGAALDHTLHANIANLQKDIKALWDAIYKDLKE